MLGRKSGRALLALCLAASAARAEPKFDGYDIRVIRPRYFVKAGKIELASGLGAIVNQTFIYSAVATGLLTWHASEVWALEAQAGYAFNADREDKRKLKDRFGISTVLLRPEQIANLRVGWTPSYGKFHLGSHRIVYFDTHVTAGAGITGVRYLYDHCEDPASVPEKARERVPTPPSPRVVQYPTYVLGAGQRYFLDERSSVRLAFEVHRVMADPADTDCGGTDGAVSATKPADNLLLFVAWSYYL